MPEEDYLIKVKQHYPLEKIRDIINSFAAINVLVIGDTIIDEYHFTVPKGRAVKDPILSVDYINHETYAGGALAIANHVSNFVDKVTVATLLGDTNDKKDFILSALNSNVQPRFFVKPNAPTIVKKRYLNKLRNEKLFKVEYIDDWPVTPELEAEIIRYLKQVLPQFDLVLVGDFGHGFLTGAIIKTLEEQALFLCANAQCNSANLGFNYATKYCKPTFLTMDMPELQYAVADRFSPVAALMQQLYDKKKFGKFLVTLGSEGTRYSVLGNQLYCPAFVSRPKDTIGAGDAVFSVTSLFAFAAEDELIPLIANCAGGVAVEYLGNKESVNKEKLLAFISAVYNGDRRQEKATQSMF